MKSLSQAEREIRKRTEEQFKNIPIETLCESINKISEAMTKLSESGLKLNAVVALIKDDTGLGKGLIETVLSSLTELRRKYCK